MEGNLELFFDYLSPGGRTQRENTNQEMWQTLGQDAFNNFCHAHTPVTKDEHLTNYSPIFFYSISNSIQYSQYHSPREAVWHDD